MANHKTHCFTLMVTAPRNVTERKVLKAAERIIDVGLSYLLVSLNPTDERADDNEVAASLETIKLRRMPNKLCGQAVEQLLADEEVPEHVHERLDHFAGKTFEVEMYVGTMEPETWQTIDVKVPADTPEELIEKAATEAFMRLLAEWEEPVAFYGVYHIPSPDDRTYYDAEDNIWEPEADEEYEDDEDRDPD